MDLETLAISMNLNAARYGIGRATVGKPSAVWNLGFRPFFLGGAAYAVFLLVLWIAYLMGAVPFAGAHFQAVAWHSHEMIFGFTMAIVAGFILTASQNWSGKPGVSGGRLQALFFLWLAGRIVLLLSQNWLIAMIDLAFIPALMYALIPYLWIPEQKKNRVFFILLTVMFIANLSMHLQTMGIPPSISYRPDLMALYIIILMIALIGGRILPFFTSRAVPEARIQKRSWVEYGTAASTVLLVALMAWNPMSAVTGAMAFVSAAFHFYRWLGWDPKRAAKVPILFILHIAYAWIFIGFALVGLSSFGLLGITPSTALHGLTVGALGVMVYGMITRVSLGHTGRGIKADSWTLAGYISILLAAIFRVFLPMLAPQKYLLSLQLSALCWLAAFLIFVIHFAPILMSPRPDGRPG